MEKKLYLRGDAAFAKPDVYEYLEENHVLYAIRLKVEMCGGDNLDATAMRIINRGRWAATQ